MMKKKEVAVTFMSKKLRVEFQDLKAGNYEEKKLYGFITRAIQDLRDNPGCGIRMPGRIWKKPYSRYSLSNLWKLDLPKGWRLIYTLESEDIKIISIILEWFCHKDYEKRFSYRVREEGVPYRKQSGINGSV